MINLLHGNDEFSSNQFLKGIVEQKNISEFDLNVVETNDLTENKFKVIADCEVREIEIQLEGDAQLNVYKSILLRFAEDGENASTTETPVSSTTETEQK